MEGVHGEWTEKMLHVLQRPLDIFPCDVAPNLVAYMRALTSNTYDAKLIRPGRGALPLKTTRHIKRTMLRTMNLVTQMVSLILLIFYELIHGCSFGLCLCLRFCQRIAAGRTQGCAGDLARVPS